jgi:hypothetical protein
MIARAANPPSSELLRPTEKPHAHSGSRLLLTLYFPIVVLLPKLPIVSIPGYVVPLRTEDLFIGLCLVVGLFSRWRIGALRKARWTTLAMGAFVGSCLISLAINYSHISREEIVTGVLIIIRLSEYFSTMFIAIFLVRDRNDVNAVVTSLLITVFVLNVYCVLQLLGLAPVIDAMHTRGDIVHVWYITTFDFTIRLIGTFGGPYDLGAFYSLVICGSIILVAGDTVSRLQRLSIWLLVGFSLVGLALTQARGPIVGAAVAIAMSLCLKRRFLPA